MTPGGRDRETSFYMSEMFIEGTHLILTEDEQRIRKKQIEDTKTSSKGFGRILRNLTKLTNVNLDGTEK